MRKIIGWSMAASVCLLLVAPAKADRRANLSAARSNLGGASAARANVGAARGNVNAANLGAARGNISANRPNINTGNLNRPNINTGNLNRPNINTGNLNRPSTSIPSLGGGTSINRPSVNRPNISQPAVTLPELNRPSNRPDFGNIGTTRPGVIENLPNRPDFGNIGNRPGGGSSIPDLGSRPITRPDFGNINRPDLGNIGRPDLGNINRPDLGNIGGNLRPDRPGGIQRPDFDNLPVDRPSRDRLEDFLGIQRPDRDLPNIDRPGFDRPEFERPNFDRPNIDRPNLGDRPSIDRPSWTERPERPIIGGGDRNINIHNPPSWVNIDRDRLQDVRNRWGNAIERRPDDLHRWTQRRPDRVARWRIWGNSVRFRWHISGHGVFGPIWWSTHRPVFCYWHHWHHWNRHPWVFWWNRPAFPVLTRWFVWRAPVVVWSQPIFYDFGPGGNVNFIDNRVFISGADVGSTEEFAQSAADLATVPPPESEEELEEMEWMALGTFAVSTSEKEGEPTRFIQLAVSQTGLISGTYFNEQTEVSQTVLGMVDPQTQRVAMRLGEDEDLVMETGLYNLTLEEAPVLVHFGPDKYEFFLLVRMDAPEDLNE